LFCERSYQRIIRGFRYWYWAESIAPYAAVQTLLVLNRHVVSLGEMTDEERAEMCDCMQRIDDAYERVGIQKVRQLQHTRFDLIRRSRAEGIVTSNEHYHMQFMRYEDGDLDPVILETAWQQD